LEQTFLTTSLLGVYNVWHFMENHPYFQLPIIMTNGIDVLLEIDVISLNELLTLSDLPVIVTTVY